MELKQLLQKAREIWGDEKMSREDIVIALGVDYGDICRVIRDANEGGSFDEDELKKELGNVIFSTIRWIDDLGYSSEDCVSRAIEAQTKYVSKRAQKFQK